MDMTQPQHDKDGKSVTVFINGTRTKLPKEQISYEELVALAFNNNPPTGDTVQITVQYTKGHSDKPKGTLVEGQSVKAKEGMEFDVTATNRS
jgi:uncharacterized protein (DUF342 family)